MLCIDTFEVYLDCEQLRMRWRNRLRLWVVELWDELYDDLLEPLLARTTLLSADLMLIITPRLLMDPTVERANKAKELFLYFQPCRRISI